MWYLWKNETNSGWQLLESSEDEEHIKNREKELNAGLATSVGMFRSMCTKYMVTDHDVPDAEKKH